MHQYVRDEALDIVADYAKENRDFLKSSIIGADQLEYNLRREPVLKERIRTARLYPITEREVAYCLAWATLAKIVYVEDGVLNQANEEKVVDKIGKTQQDSEGPGG